MVNRAILRLNLDPTPKGRPVISAYCGRVRAYTPGRTRLAEEHMAQLVRSIWTRGVLSGPIAIRVTFFFSNETSRKKKRVGPHTQRPDLNNCVKLVKDSLNGVIWRDDSQIHSIKAKKAWTLNEPSVELVVLWDSSPSCTD